MVVEAAPGEGVPSRRLSALGQGRSARARSCRRRDAAATYFQTREHLRQTSKSAKADFIREMFCFCRVGVVLEARFLSGRCSTVEAGREAAVATYFQTREHLRRRSERRPFIRERFFSHYGHCT